MRSTIVLTALAALCFAPAAFADRDHDRGPGKGHAYGHYKHKDKDRDDRDREVRTVVVYPPWIVRERNEYVYAPKYRPQPVATGVVRCNSAAVGSVLGGVVGGVLGNQIGQGDGRTLATIGGAVAGVLVGGEIGRRMDAGNQACVGEVLEVAPVNHRVQWVQGPSTYVVVPSQVVMRSGRHCRPYTLEIRGPNGVQRSRGTACRRGDGVWVAG